MPIDSLPITSPYCVTDACRAFREGFADDERKTPLLRLLEYGSWTVWFYSFWILLFTAIYVYHQVKDRLVRRKAAHGRPSLKDKTIALVRFWIYRRPDNCFSTKIGLRQTSYGTLALLAIATVFFAILPWPQYRYLRARFRFGSPPLSVRCAMIISALTPLTVVLAGKVNVITWMTGVGYEKLNVYHRYVAYVIFYLSTIHTVSDQLLDHSRSSLTFFKIPHLIAPVKDGGWSMLNKLYANEARELSGTPLYFATFGLAFFSIPWVRNRSYEAFKYLHIFLAVAYIGLFWWHIYGEYISVGAWTLSCKALTDIVHQPCYIYATVASLFFSNIIRLVQRHRNLRSFSNLAGFPTTIESLHGNMSRITVEVPKSMKWKPGQHAFIRILSLSWLGNHPFSIGNIPSTERGGSTHEMVFLVRRHDGFTKKLCRGEPVVPSETESETGLFETDLEKPNIVNTPIIHAPSKAVMGAEKPVMAEQEKGVEHIENINTHVDAITVVQEEVLSPMSPFAQASFPLTVDPPLRSQPSFSSLPPRDEITEAKLKFIAEKPAGVRSSSQPSSSRISGSTRYSCQPPTNGTSGKRRASFSSFPPRDEITETKLEVIASKSGIRTSLRTIIDGPYGTHHRPLHKIYDTVLCVAGGCGITASLPHVLDLAQRLSVQTKDKAFTTKRIHLVWIIRDVACCTWIEKELNAAIRNIREHPSPSNITFTVDIYITRSADLAESASPSEAQLSPISPISPMLDDKAFEAAKLDLERGTITLPSRPRPALRRLNGGRGLFDSEESFGITKDDGASNRGVSVATHYCRPVVRDVVEGYCSGERMIVLGTYSQLPTLSRISR